MSFVTRSGLLDAIARLDVTFARPGRLLLLGEASLLVEGWRDWLVEVTVTAEVAPADRPAFEDALKAVADSAGITIWNEDPGTVIPLPQGVSDRHRPVAVLSTRHLTLAHFDPYSTAFRYIARGDEPDYHLVLALIDQGWITLEEMDDILNDLLPRFSMETIQQDPAEFRRKYKGLLQMTHSVRPGALHRQ